MRITRKKIRNIVGRGGISAYTRRKRIRKMGEGGNCNALLFTKKRKRKFQFPHDITTSSELNIGSEI